MTLDEIIKEVRKELSITQEQLARDLNVSSATLSRWENNHNTPSRLARMRLLEYCLAKGVSKNIINALEKSSSC
jgi:transcriptional regulator with XRE-family HTH domain